jgi:ACR3 family arsenite efflux pump ArsB
MRSTHVVATVFLAIGLAVAVSSQFWPGHTALLGAISIARFSLLTAASLFVWRRDLKRAAASHSRQTP